MKQVARVGLMFWVVVSMIVMGGAAFAASGGGVRKIVVFREGATPKVQRAVVEGYGGNVLHILPLINGAATQLPATNADAVAAALQNNPHVAGIYDDLRSGGDHVVVFTAVSPPLVEAYPWGEERIGVPLARQLLAGLTTPGPVVAVMDTGIDVNHPELKQSIVGGYNARAGENPGNYQDYNGHGTHMAGIIAAAQNSQGIIGTVLRPRIVAVKVLDNTAHGYLSDFINGLQWVLTQGIGVINMSLSFQEDSPLLQSVISQLYMNGVIMVASAGNVCGSGGQDDGGEDDGGETGCDPVLDPSQRAIRYPARYPWVIAVGATDFYNHVTGYSRTGPELDLVAPGGSRLNQRILSTIPGSAYAYGSGTSPAAAHVSGTVAMLLELAPVLTFEQVLSLLQTTATNLGYPAEQQGAGLVNLEKAVKSLLGLP